MAILPTSNGSILLFHSSTKMKLSFQSLGTGVVLIEGNIWMGSWLEVEVRQVIFKNTRTDIEDTMKLLRGNVGRWKYCLRVGI